MLSASELNISLYKIQKTLMRNIMVLHNVKTEDDMLTIHESATVKELQ